MAAKNNKIDLLKIFLKDPDACDVNIKAAEIQRGFTPLHVAAENGSIQCLEYLLEIEEVDVDAKDIKGDITPLQLAIKNQHQAAAVKLIQYGANLDIKVCIKI